MSAITGTDRPRNVTFLRLHETAGWRLKFYRIGRARAELVRTAELLAPSALPAPAVHHGGDDPYDIDRYGVGFVIVHETSDYAFALYDWWAGQNEIHQRIFSSLPTRLEAMRPHPTRAIGSVWELAVIDFERRAWVRHMLDGDEPDIEAYLADRVTGDEE